MFNIEDDKPQHMLTEKMFLAYGTSRHIQAFYKLSRTTSRNLGLDVWEKYE